MFNKASITKTWHQKQNFPLSSPKHFIGAVILGREFMSRLYSDLRKI